MPVTHALSKRVEGEEEPMDHVGRLLQYEREKKHLSKDDISQNLRLPVAVIRKLETGRFSELPHPVYIRGYIRAYCELLEIDPRPLLDGLELPSQEQGESDSPDSVNEDVYRLTRIWGSLVVLSIIVLLVSFWWFERSRPLEPAASVFDVQPLPGQGSQPSALTPPQTGKVSPVDVDGGGRERTGIVGVADPQARPPGIVFDAPAGSVADENRGQTDEEGFGAAAETVGETVRPVTERAIGSPTVAGSDAAELMIRLVDRRSWIEITDGEGRTLVAGMFSPGYQATVDGVFPLQFRLGDARGLRIWINGSEYDLQEHISQLNTAFFVLYEPPLP